MLLVQTIYFVKIFRLASEHDVQGLLDQLPQAGEEAGCGSAVDGPVVDGQGQRHGGGDGDLVADHDGLADGFADGEDGGLRRVDDRGELADPVHAEVADGERAIGELVRGELAGPRPGGEVVCLAGDLGEGFAVGVADDGDDEPVIDGDRDADVDVAVPQDAGLVPGDVDLGAVGQRPGAGPGEQVGDGDLDVRAVALVGPDAEGEQLVGGGHNGQVEVRGFAGAGGEALCGEAADRGQRDLLGVRRRGQRHRGRGDR